MTGEQLPRLKTTDPTHSHAATRELTVDVVAQLGPAAATRPLG